jgi:hypothetical protein
MIAVSSSEDGMLPERRGPWSDRTPGTAFGFGTTAESNPAITELASGPDISTRFSLVFSRSPLKRRLGDGANREHTSSGPLSTREKADCGA